MLDHASRLVNYGCKMGIDVSGKWAEEGFRYQREREPAYEDLKSTVTLAMPMGYKVVFDPDYRLRPSSIPPQYHFRRVFARNILSAIRKRLTSMANLKRNHHYLPQCYQEGFTNAVGQVWVRFAGEEPEP